MSLITDIANRMRLALNTKQSISGKNQINGYLGLNSEGKINETFFPVSLLLKKIGNSQYYSSPATSNSLTTANLLANTVYAMPLILDRKTKIDNLILSVTTATAGSSIITGIYNDTNLYPNSLIHDFGTNTSNTTGLKTYTKSIPLQLENGLYWLICISNLNVSIKGFNSNNMISILGFDNLLSNNPGLGYSIGRPFGALPIIFPASGTIRTTAPLPTLAIRSIL